MSAISHIPLSKQKPAKLERKRSIYSAARLVLFSSPKGILFKNAPWRLGRQGSRHSGGAAPHTPSQH